MKKLIYLVLALLFAFPMLMVSAQDDVVTARLEEYGNNLPRGYGLISASDLSGLLSVQDTVLLDVRQPEEFEAGHLANSFNVPIRTLGQNLDLLPDVNASIVVICKSGGRATLAATSLEILGYTNVKILKGGFNAWVGEDLPSTTDVFDVTPAVAPEFDPAVYAAVDNYLTNLPDGFAMISAPNLMAEVARQAPVLIDVRSDAEWETGYIAGAQHIWINDFVNQLDQLPADKSTPVVVYCQSGYRGGMVAVMMNVLGYTNVLNLAGGLNSWNAAGLPLEGVPLDLQTVEADFASALPADFDGISVTDLAAELDTDAAPLLVDVRTTDEVTEGFIAGAINIPMTELTQHLDLLPNLDQNIVVYCGSGYRSAISMTALRLLGYTNVRSMLGGFGAWTGAELPVSTTPTETTAGTPPTIDPALFDAVNNFMTNIPAGFYTVKALDLTSEMARNPVTLIDVRTDEEWAAGYIDGAIHMPLNSFFAQPDQLPQDMAAPIVVYGSTSHRGAIAMSMLRVLGYENVRALAGGVGAWEKAGFALVN